MADYFASDVHLRIDRPERGRRFARFVGGLEPGGDTLTIVGDLCDFWLVARQVEDDGEGEGDGACPPACDGLRALAGFRGRGGAVSILAGNHDSWLGPYYEKALGLDLRVEPLDLLVHGIRVRLVHGHLLEPHRGWKAWMEGQSFLRLFRGLPGPAAVVLDRLLQWKNVRSRPSDERHYYAVFRRYADRCRGEADLVVVGHVHTPLDDHARDPRLVVLGGWHAQSSYLKIDDEGASLLIETDDALISRGDPDLPDPAGGAVDLDSDRVRPVI